MKIVIVAAIFVMVSLWEYCSYFYKQKKLPYVHGFLSFTMFQWIIITINLIHLFGWIYGILGLLGAMFILQYVTHFTVGIIYSFIFGNNPLWPLALFATSVWVCGILTVISFFV